jgi:hypothetical protein
VGIAHSSAMEQLCGAGHHEHNGDVPGAATASRKRLFTATEKLLLEGVLAAHHSPVRSRSIACDEGNGQVLARRLLVLGRRGGSLPSERPAGQQAQGIVGG